MMAQADTELGKHAAVLGAGMAGLLAARVLSEFYQTVTVVERDPLPGTPKAIKAAENDIVLTETFHRVNSLIDPPTRLRDPSLIPRVIVGNLRRRQA